MCLAGNSSAQDSQSAGFQKGSVLRPLQEGLRARPKATTTTTTTLAPSTTAAPTTTTTTAAPSTTAAATTAKPTTTAAATTTAAPTTTAAATTTTAAPTTAAPTTAAATTTAPPTTAAPTTTTTTAAPTTTTTAAPTTTVASRVCCTLNSSPLCDQADRCTSGGGTWTGGQTCGCTYPSSGSSSTATGGSGCFVAGTPVLMADGSTRAIESLKPGDSIWAGNGKSNEVQALIVIKHEGKKFAFNGDGNYFVTESHPFLTTQGWKSLNPKASRKEVRGLKVSLLGVDDEILTVDSKVRINRIQYRTNNQTVYNLMVDGDHEYFANGYRVHNKNLAPGWTL